VPIDTNRLRALIRDVPDFPQKGIVFKDITPLLADQVAFSSVIDETVVHFGRGNVDRVVGIEARGFILASPVAYHFGAGFVPVRKAGKLPASVESEEYNLEYGTATLEIHNDAIAPGQRVLIVDDVLATGGTARASARLVERLGGKVVGIATLIELGFLGGRKLIEGYESYSFCGHPCAIAAMAGARGVTWFLDPRIAPRPATWGVSEAWWADGAATRGGPRRARGRSRAPVHLARDQPERGR
jgi:adenine phosphoribosyltransferase